MNLKEDSESITECQIPFEIRRQSVTPTGTEWNLKQRNAFSRALLQQLLVVISRSGYGGAAGK